MGVTVLIVDDDEVLGGVLARVLTRQGYTVRLAGTVLDAVAAAREFQPRIALLDLCLPDGNGIALAAQLRAEHEKLALVLITAFPLRLPERPELKTDFARVLLKPLDLADLRHALEAVASVA